MKQDKRQRVYGSRPGISHGLWGFQKAASYPAGGLGLLLLGTLCSSQMGLSYHPLCQLGYSMHTYLHTHTPNRQPDMLNYILQN